MTITADVLKRYGVQGAGVLVLTGCGMGVTASPTDTVLGTLKGSVHGGNAPVTGATLVLLQTSAAGYNGTATALGVTTTDANGNFQFPSGTAANCTAGNYAYLLATGGNPGQTNGTNNTGLVEMAAVGACSSLSSSTTIEINEVTTIAAAYALSGFLPAGGAGITYATITGITSAGQTMAGVTTSPTNTLGLKDAFLNAAAMVNSATGQANTVTPTGGTVPVATINALGNILAACVNSTGAANTPCTGTTSPVTTGLYTAATPPTGSGISAPANTLQAAIDIAQYPGNNVATLFSLETTNPAFGTTLTAAPNDWTLGISFTSSLMSSPLGMGLDDNDNVYVTGSYQASPLIDADLIEFTPQGGGGSTDLVSPTTVPAGATTALTAASQNIRWVAADRSGNLWLTDGGSTNAGVFEYTTAAATNFYSYSSTTDTNTNNYALALDEDGDVWLADYKKSTCTGAGTATPCELIELAKGATTAYSPYISFPNAATSPTASFSVVPPDAGGARGIAYDVTHDAVWVTDINGSTVDYFKVTPSTTGVAVATSAAVTAQLGTSASSDATNNYGAVSVAVDGSGNGWVVVTGGSASTKSGSTTAAVPAALYKVVPAATSGTAVTNVAGSAAAGGGLVTPAYLAIDGNGNIFIANGGGASSSAVAEYSPSFNSNAGAYLSANNGFNPNATFSAGAYTGGLLYKSTYVAVDHSGALWVLDGGTGSSSSPAALVQILGVAAPTEPVLAKGSYGVKP